jgi:hypothetical protein
VRIWWFVIPVLLSLVYLMHDESRPSRAQSTVGVDPAIYLLPPEDLPEGFEHQPHRDRTITEPGISRALRFYTRGAPEVPTEEHASILLAASISDSADLAAMDFQQTVLTWTSLGYDLEPLENAVGEEAVSGWDLLYVNTEHPKQAALLLFRAGIVNATVQWTDEPDRVTLDHAATVARLMELRIVAQNAASEMLLRPL